MTIKKTLLMTTMLGLCAGQVHGSELNKLPGMGVMTIDAPTGPGFGSSAISLVGNSFSTAWDATQTGATSMGEATRDFANNSTVQKTAAGLGIAAIVATAIRWYWQRQIQGSQPASPAPSAVTPERNDGNDGTRSSSATPDQQQSGNTPKTNGSQPASPEENPASNEERDRDRSSSTTIDHEATGNTPKTNGSQPPSPAPSAVTPEENNGTRSPSATPLIAKMSTTPGSRTVTPTEQTTSDAEGDDENGDPSPVKEGGAPEDQGPQPASPAPSAVTPEENNGTRSPSTTVDHEATGNTPKANGSQTGSPEEAKPRKPRRRGNQGKTAPSGTTE
jgi:hypothetical protein